VTAAMSGVDPGPVADPEITPEAMIDATRRTYRYLRVSVVAMALLLGTSLVLEIVWGTGESFGSISGYYYTPVRSVLVGTLVAMGPALIALKGRPGWEDTLLSLAGMVIPLVAFVPASFAFGPGVCQDDAAKCVPPDLVPSVDNNVTALLIVGAAGLAFAWWNSRGVVERAARTGLRFATLVWLAFFLWFTLGHDSFLMGAHYAAAIMFFLLIAGVAYFAGRDVRKTGRPGDPGGMSAATFSHLYRAISLLMALSAAGAGLLYLVSVWRGTELWPSTIFVVEAALLVLFVAFWVLQTIENWDEEAVEAQSVTRRVS
jgi:hypothetical protein